MDSPSQFQTTIFGPCRIIGMSYQGDGQNNEIPQLWNQFCARCNETDLREPGFGVCRCTSGGTEGSGEYIAAFLAGENASVREGMLALDLPQCEYAVFPVPEIPEVRNVWRSSLGKVNASTEWDRYRCGSNGCACISHPAFEYYPPGYRGIYVPIKRKGTSDT